MAALIVAALLIVVVCTVCIVTACNRAAQAVTALHVALNNLVIQAEARIDYPSDVAIDDFIFGGSGAHVKNLQ